MKRALFLLETLHLLGEMDEKPGDRRFCERVMSRRSVLCASGSLGRHEVLGTDRLSFLTTEGLAGWRWCQLPLIAATFVISCHSSTTHTCLKM